MVLLTASLLAVSYLIKSDTFDLLVYKEYFKSPAEYEYIFWTMSDFLNRLGLKPESVLLFWQASIAAISIIAVKKFARRLDLALLVLLCTPYFFLGSQNVLRQGVSVSFGLLAIALWFVRDQRILPLIALAFSFLTHRYTGLILTAVIFLFLIFNHFLPRKKLFHFLAGLAFGVLCVGIIEIYFSSFVYFDDQLYWGTYRSDRFTKLLGVSSVFILLSSISVPCSMPKFVSRLVYLRLFFFGICVPFIRYSEAFSRLVFIAYGLDFLLLSILVNCPIWRFFDRLKLFLVFFLYGLAPNVIRVFLGLA